MRGGDLTISYTVKSPSGIILAEDLGATSAETTIEAKEDGVYDFCFDNRKSMLAEKVVYFDLGIYDDTNQILHSDFDSVLATDNSTDSEMYSEIVVSMNHDIVSLDEIQILKVL